MNTRGRPLTAILEKIEEYAIEQSKLEQPLMETQSLTVSGARDLSGQIANGSQVPLSWPASFPVRVVRVVRGYQFLNSAFAPSHVRQSVLVRR